MKRVSAYLLVAVLACPSVGLAQQPASNGSVDVTKLGVSLDRIRRELAEPPAEAADGSPIKLQIRVEVFGSAPKINLLEGVSFESDAVPYGSPTHQEVLNVLTPQEFRAPVMPISGMVLWAAQQLWQRSKKSRCEQEIAEYRALVMQGVAVAAPRCTQ